MAPSLAEADGTEFVIERAHGPLDANLQALGFVPGTCVRLLRRARGYVLVALGDSRYALGEEVARSILVRRC